MGDIDHNPLIRMKDDYQILNIISRGSYGVVYRARDKKTNEIVAVKRELGGPCKATLTEIEFLKALPLHPCIVEFKKVIMGEGSSVFVVMEYLEYDLKRYMNQRKKPLMLIEVKYIMEEILKGVQFLHGEGVMHRDLKPSNVLFSTSNVRVKICDFGLSAPFGNAQASHCPRVGTLWYKAPELLMGKWTYSYAVDMWSVGCIMAELVLGQPLFQGKSKVEQLGCIQQITKSPVPLLYKMGTAALEGKAELTASGYDLLHRLLAYEPEKRITAIDALDHSWFWEN